MDAANVFGSRPDGWWRDRPVPPAGWSGKSGPRWRRPDYRCRSSWWSKGAARRGAAEGTADQVEVVHAPGSGDDVLAALAAAAEDPVLLVSADRGLRARVRPGVTTVGPRWLLERIEAFR